MKYEFVELVGVRVVGLMTRTSVGNVGVTDDVPKLWRDFYRTRVEQCLSDIDSERYRYATVSYGYDRRTEQFNVIVGCFKKPFGRETSGFQKCVVPAGMYAKVEVDGVDPGSISRAWGEIYSDARILKACDFKIKMKAYRQAGDGVDIFISAPNYSRQEGDCRT